MPRIGLNKTFPAAAKASTKVPSKNWSKTSGGKIVWPLEMKTFLVSRIKEHVSVLENDTARIDPDQKMRVWEQIYKALIRRGMPDSDVRTVKKVWAGLRASTIEAFRRHETKRRNTRNTVEISDLQRAVYEVVELSRKLKTTGNSAMPLPIRIKMEIVEEDEAVVSGGSDSTVIADEQMQMDDATRQHQLEQLHRSQAVVMIEPLNLDTKNIPPLAVLPANPPKQPTPQPEPDTSNANHADPEDEQSMPMPFHEVSASATAPTNPAPPPVANELPMETNAPEAAARPLSPANEPEISPECRRIYEQIAEAELKMKLLQQQKEEQSLQYEKEIYIRRLAILDAELKRRNIEIELLSKSHEPAPLNINCDPLGME